MYGTAKATPVLAIGHSQMPSTEVRSFDQILSDIRRNKNQHFPRLKGQELEQEALLQCPAVLYYDLADNISETSDEELLDIIGSGEAQ